MHRGNEAFMKIINSPISGDDNENGHNKKGINKQIDSTNNSLETTIINDKKECDDASVNKSSSGEIFCEKERNEKEIPSNITSASVTPPRSNLFPPPPPSSPSTTKPSKPSNLFGISNPSTSSSLPSASLNSGLFGNISQSRTI